MPEVQRAMLEGVLRLALFGDRQLGPFQLISARDCKGEKADFGAVSRTLVRGSGAPLEEECSAGFRCCCLEVVLKALSLKGVSGCRFRVEI